MLNCMHRICICSGTNIQHQIVKSKNKKKKKKKKKKMIKDVYPINLMVLPRSSLIGVIVRRFQKGVPSFL
jgi:hypothetical protein